MLIIGKNIRNQSTKIQIAYVAKAGLDRIPGACDCPRPELMRKRAMLDWRQVLWEKERELKQPIFGWHILEEVVDSGNGGEASLDAPSNYEQNVNKGADKKTEGFTLCFLLVPLGAN